VKDKELYDKFMCFCNGGEAELQKTVADSKQTIETMSSKAEQETAEKAGFEGDLVKHKADRVQAGEDLDKATAIRSKEQAEYEEELADQKSSFEAVSKAIPALETGMGGASASFLQNDDMSKKLQHALEFAMNKETISSGEKDSVMAFLQGKQGYSPVSGEIVGILKNMKDEMEKSIKEIESTEEMSVSGYADLKAAKEQEIEVNSEAIEVKTKRVGELAVSIVQASDAVEDAKVEEADATKFLATLATQCKEKSAQYAERSKMRAEEVSAISEAISILNDDDALDVFKKAVPSALLQEQASHGARKFGFLQSTKATDPLRRAQGIISSAAQLHKSRQLDLLQYTINAKLRARSHGAVDFSEITKMIDEMVGVLTKEQADDDKHKTWCQGEFMSSGDEKTKTETTIASITAAMSEAADEIASVTDDIKALTEGVAALDKDVATATEQRKTEHAEYLETVSLTEAAIELMGKAKNRLQKFYNPALYKAPPKKELTDEEAIISKMSFAQVSGRSHVAPPEYSGETGTYEKKSQKSGGVMALMDMLVKELETSLTEAEHEEKTAQAEYVELMADSEATRASDTKSITDKSASKATLESSLTDMKENKALTTEELGNINAYIAELHGSCDFIMENFKLRSDARTNEVESLKNAKAVLAGASYSM